MATTFRRTLLAALVAGAAVTLSVGCDEDVASPPPVPDGWTQVEDCVGSLRFALAPDMAPEIVQPIDSCVGVFERPSQWMTYDFGWYGGSFDELLGPPYTDPDAWTEDVDGRAGRFITSREAGDAQSYLTALEVNDVQPGSTYPIKLLFFARGASLADRDEALATFRSVDFHP